MFVTSLLVLGIAMALGLWLAGRQINAPRAFSRLSAAGCVHGGLGAAGLALLALTLRVGPTAHAIRLGAGGFGWLGFSALAAALGFGALILVLRMRRRALPMAVLAVHGVLAIAGAVLLMAYAGLQG
jgi:hypothetical protein